MKAIAALIGLMLLAACLPGQGPGLGPVSGTASAVAARGQCQPDWQAPPVNACTGPDRISLTIAGDVLLHWQLQDLGYKRGFQGVWAQAAPFIRTADIAIANMEGPVAPGLTRTGTQLPDPGPVFDDKVYTGFPRFNYHPAILRDLKRAGFDLLTTANNHAMDRGARGADLTLGEMARAGITPVGTIRAGAARDFLVTRQTRAGRVAFVACSFSTNGNPDPNRQVLLCYRDRAELLSIVRRAARTPDIAAVIVLPHWGQEYRSAPDARQQALARDLAAAGATAIIGTHPHAVQPFALLDGPGARVPVAYSTGNFIAVQDQMPSKVGALALLELCPGASGKLVAERFGWIAGQMEFTTSAYWLNIAPAGTPGAMGQAERHLNRIAPGFSAQPQACR